MKAISDKTMAEFRSFCNQAKACMGDPQPDAGAPLNDFREFLANATPMIINRVRAKLPALMSTLVTIEPWLVDHDLLAIAGFRLAEDPYTELLAWALAPSTHLPTAVRRQEAWLRHLGMDGMFPIKEPAQPKTQVVTHDGIPDLVLQYEQFAVVVEAKTETAEHDTPSGMRQTMAYADAVRRRLGLSPDFRVEVVFLTLAGDEAANPDARLATFVDFTRALVGCLDPEELPGDCRWAFAAVFTHLLSCATPDGSNLCDIFRSALEWRQLNGWENDDSLLLHRLPVLEAAMTTLHLE